MLKYNKNTNRIIGLLAILVIGISIISILIFSPNIKYKKALGYASEGEYEKAVEIFNELKEYKDSETKVKGIKYLIAEELAGGKEFEKAIAILNELREYKDSEIRVKYLTAEKLADEKEFE